MKLFSTPSTRRVISFCVLVLFVVLAFTALAASIPSAVTVNFDGLSFVDGMDYGSNVFTQGDFTFTASSGIGNWVEGGAPFCQGGSNGCLNATSGGQATVTIQTTTGNTFSFASFWDLNICGFGSNGITSAQGYLNGTLVVTQTTGFPNDMSCSGSGAPATVPMNSGFQNVNKVVLTSLAGGFADNLDQFIFNPSIVSQTITFANPGAQNFGTSPTLTATATSGLTVTFTSSTTGVCTITSGGTLTFVTAGTCTINADQAGSVNFFAAPTVSRSFTVNAVVPGAPTIGTATAGNTSASVAFTPPASTGGAAIITYTATSSPGGFTGSGASPITVNGLTNGIAYTFTVTATNSAGTGPASGASNSVTPKAPQTITFNNPGAQNFGTTPTLTATSTSGLTVTFTSSTTGVCTITAGGALTFVTASTCTINADQAGNGSFLAATQVSRSFTVNAVVPGTPTIGTATAGDTQATVSFTAPVSNGGATITGYTVTANPGGATGTGATSPITVTGLTNGTAYTFTVTATNSAGTGSASAASNSVTPKAAQTITFANPGAQNFGTTPTVTATSTSSLTVTFTSSTTGVCTITSGGALTFVTTGTCTINADQAGNGSFLAAATVSRSFTVNAVVPGAPTIGTATAGDTQATVAFTAPAFTGGGTITGYTATSNPGGLTGSGAASPITVTGLTDGTAYTFTVTATNSAGTGSPSAASNSVTPAANQTITFANPGAQTFGTTPTLTATASSGLTVAFTSATPAVCTITSGGALTLVSSGTCTINANQAGNASFLAAPQVSRSFSVLAVVPGVPTIGTATAGNAQASVTFTAPASTGGAPIISYTVTSNPGGITATGTSSPILVSGLTNGTAYTFTVKATSSAGTGSPSAPSNSVTPQGATVPQSGSVSVVSGSGQSSPLGTPFAAPLFVVVKDASGSVIPNVTVAFNVVTGSATLSPTFAVTGVDGTAQITATPTAAGVITIWATVSGLPAAAIFVETGLGTATSQLSVLPPALTFTAVQGGANPLPASIAVSNTGTGTLQWTATASGNPAWLTLGPTSGATAAVITASVNAAGLAVGNYQATVTVTSGSQQQTVAVALTVQPSGPSQFTLTPSTLLVNASAGSTAPLTRSVNVTNAGSGTLSWTAAVNTSSASWLSVGSSSGTTPSSVSVQFNPSGLAAGQYLGTITFSAPGVASSTVAVIFNISALPDLISSVPLLQFRGPVGSSFSPQTLPITTTTGAAVSFTATASVTSGANWLTINGGTASTPASITASVNSGGLAAGYYVGYILVQSAGARNTLPVPVVLDLGGVAPTGTLAASPGGVLFTGPVTASQSSTLTQTVSLSSDSAPFSWNAAAVAGTGGTWLSVSPQSGSGNGSITLTANLAGLQPGAYTAQAAISSTGTSNPQLIVPVALIVSSGSTTVTTTNTLQPIQPAGNFVASVGVPFALQASILSPTGAPVTGGNVQVAFSTGDATVTLTDVGGGLYSGVWTPLQAGPVSLLFTTVNAPTGVVTGVVSTPGGKQPALAKNGVVNGASFAAGMPLGVGSIGTLFGQNLGSQTATATSLPLPLSLGGASVTINGIPAPLFYVSPGQINFFVPYELAGQTTATIAVSTSAGVVEVTGVPIAPQSPAIFLLDAAGDAAALHLDGTVVSTTSPASAGEALEIFATGLGPVSNTPADGTAPPSGTLAVDQLITAVTIGGVNAQVLFAGLAPGFVGLYQLNVVVPSGLPAGPATITISEGSLPGNSAVIQLH
jgi:uncharacterized protein (TIGR03437 family)